MNKVILISGRQGSGKSSVARQVHELLFKTKLFSVHTMAYADPLYKMHDKCLEIMDDYGIETPAKDGRLLQLLGTEWGRKTYGENLWVEIARNKIEKYVKTSLSGKPLVTIISDVRFPNEAEIYPDAIRVRLECPESVRKARILKTPGQNWRPDTNHPSETALDGYKNWSLVIDTERTPANKAAEMVVGLLTFEVKEKK